MPTLIGRYEIRRELGRGTGHGASSTMYLAYEPALQREVALKSLKFADVDHLRNRSIGERARVVGALRHPNILPLFDTGEHEGAPYLVFKSVGVRNLAEFITQEGRIAATPAANMARQVLDALALAHRAGIAHGNLKPSNILLDATGKPWLTDFTLTALTPNPALDVSAVGRMLLGMLIGRAIPDESDSSSASTSESSSESTEFTSLRQPISIPANAGIDHPLSEIIEHACSRDPLPGLSAAEMKAKLDTYLGGAATPIGIVDSEDEVQNTLDALIRRMQGKADFPALSDSVAAINRLTNSDKGGIGQLSTAILKDYGLTNKILRMVNSPIYRTAGGGSISTISRAVMVLGFDVVRNIVITVVLFDHLEDKGNARELKEAFLRASLAGAIAREASKHMALCGNEESYICALFHNLGQLLAQYYFPDDVTQIRKLMLERNFTEGQAATHVLKISFSDLGIGIAQHWGFPPDILASLRPLHEGTVRKAVTPEGSLRVVAGFANELRDAIAANPMENKRKILAGVSRRFAGALPLTEAQLQQVMDLALKELTELGGVLQVKLKQSPFATHVKGWVTNHAPIGGGATSSARQETSTDFMAAALLDDPVLLSASDSPENGKTVPDKAQTILTAGIQDISNALVDDFKLNDILRITLETMYRAMDFQRVILFTRDSKTGTMNGRFGLGPETHDLIKNFRFPLNSPVDVFQLASCQGTDILITDIDDPNIQKKIPDWFRHHAKAKTFVLFPMNIKGKPAALIYCDRDKAGSIELPERELSLLKTLRNQALMAIKQTVV